MRPIEKKQPGDIVWYKDSCGNSIKHIIKAEYNPYGEAKLPLVGHLGRYCSYCEGLREVDALEIDHRIAQNNGGCETQWDNFLLCCKVCNTIKSTKKTGNDIHWPHKNNTLLDYVYDETGRVKLNPNLPESSKIKAQNLYNLVCLGRDNADATAKDFRWQRRYETWNKATIAKKNYIAGKWNEDDIISKARDTGYWSVWYTVFTGIDSILSRLITDFTGTCQSCFDSNDHYKPIQRNPFNMDDPV